MKLTSENFISIFTMGYMSALKDVHDYGDNQKDLIRSQDVKVKINNLGIDWIKKQEEKNNGQKKEFEKNN